jgi:hypothetical protein
VFPYSVFVSISLPEALVTQLYLKWGGFPKIALDLRDFLRKPLVWCITLKFCTDNQYSHKLMTWKP